MAWHSGTMRVLLLPLLCLMPACSDAPDKSAAPDTAAIATDPVIARALHDPLMSDPDLASRNEANAALGAPDSHALPVIAATSADASAAREAMRLELLATGPIPDLPPVQGEEDEDDENDTPAPPPLPPLGPMARPADLLAALGAPATCARRLKEDFALAASLPAAAALPPQGMVMQAGGADGAGCRIRIIRYASAAPLADVLQYHFARAKRAGLSGRRQAAPAAMIIADGKGGERLVVEARRAAHGMTGVTLLYRAP